MLEKRPAAEHRREALWVFRKPRYCTSSSPNDRVISGLEPSVRRRTRSDLPRLCTVRANVDGLRSLSSLGLAAASSGAHRLPICRALEAECDRRNDRTEAYSDEHGVFTAGSATYESQERPSLRVVPIVRAPSRASITGGA